MLPVSEAAKLGTEKTFGSDILDQDVPPNVVCKGNTSVNPMQSAQENRVKCLRGVQASPVPNFLFKDSTGLRKRKNEVNEEG